MHACTRVNGEGRLPQDRGIFEGSLLRVDAEPIVTSIQPAFLLALRPSKINY